MMRSSSTPRRPSDRTDREQTERSIADGHGHDRQVLIAGDGIAAATTAGFLDQAGLDPVVASTTDLSKRSHPEVAVLWQPGLALLERLGLRRPVQRLGTTLDRLACVTSNRSWVANRSGPPSLVAIQYDEFMELVDRILLTDIRTTEQSVTAVESTDVGVRAVFSHGIEETFDGVITTAPSLLSTREQMSAASGLHVWEFEWPAPAPEHPLPSESWDETRVGFCVPVGEKTYVRLVSAAETASIAVSVDELRREFGHLFDPSPFEKLKEQNIQYSRTTEVTPASPCIDGTALIGPTVHGSVSGDCLGTTLSIEDAWVIADTLAYGPLSIDEAFTEYNARRRQRTQKLPTATTEKAASERVPDALAPRLRQLCASRTLAFGHVLGLQCSAFEEGITQQL